MGMVDAPWEEGFQDEALRPVAQRQPRARGRVTQHAPPPRLSTLAVKDAVKGALKHSTPTAAFRVQDTQFMEKTIVPEDEYDVAPGSEYEHRVTPVQRPQPQLVAKAQTVVSQAAVTPEVRMKQQCLGFAQWVKTSGAEGPDLVNLWKSTCKPAVNAGAATQPYIQMCSALSGAVSEFKDNPHWTPASACEAVLRTFRESGVGGSPLQF